MKRLSTLLTFVFTASVMIVGCQSAYYAAREKMAKQNRHLLRDQVENSRDDQEKASEAFTNALTRLKKMYGIAGGNPEEMYNRLSEGYENCRQRAEIIDERIDKIQRIASDLFAPWRQEIDRIQNPGFRSKCARKLKDIQSRFAILESSLITARRRMSPILANLKDYVLFLKHNLNAQAMGTLQGEAVSIETNVNRLIRDISQSIKEADAFLAVLEK